MPRRSSEHYCPICNTRFINRTRCLQHMNQPNGRCHPSLHPAVLKAAQTITQKYNLRKGSQAQMASEIYEEEFNAPLFADTPMDDDEDPAPKNFYREYYPGAAQTYGRADTFMDTFRRDTHANERRSNLYYPFASADEWEITSFIVRSNMTVAATDEFLKLRLTAKMSLSFETAKDLRSRIEILPSGPEWQAITWKTQYPTKSPLTLYYRDPLECLQTLLRNPLIQDFIQFSPFRLWATSEKLMRVYTEWLSGDVAWNIQGEVPDGATVLGSILSSDKTQLSAMTGNRQAHPLLISLAAIDMDFRMKASHHAFLLLALLPIAKFREKNPEIRGVLDSRLFHSVMDFVLEPLKKTAQIGMASHTLSQLIRLEREIDPWDLSVYIKAAKKLRLNGVHRPFWRNWPLAEPSEFLTPEILHHWLKMFYDHLCQWCIQALGAAEIDFRFSEGISKAKQTTGREHRDIQRYIVPIIAGAVPKDFLTTIASLNNFFYYDILSKMSTCLKTFHNKKDSILKAGVRKGKKGPIDNCVIPAIRANGVPLQWSADVTEHAHITLNYEAQICRHLDRGDKCRHFDLATAIASAGVDFGARDPVPVVDPEPSAILDEEPSLLVNRTSELLDRIDPVARLSGTNRVNVNYFLQSSLLSEGQFPNAPLPFRTFTSPDGSTAFHLARDYVGRQITVDAAATRFRLPDLRPALAAFLHRSHGNLIARGKASVQKLEVWHNVRIQSRAFHDTNKILVPETINAAPPDRHWKCGRADAVIVNSDSGLQWPRSGLEGHTVCQVRMIFRVVPTRGCNQLAGTNGFLAYVQRFDIVHHLDPTSKVRGPFPEPASGMYQLKRARRSDQSRLGDVVPLDRLRVPVELSPRFGKTADRRLSKELSLDYCEDFWLSKWFNKELFYALSQ
ncbi:hypothetical protein DFH09DRAFT_1251065 [Mycena vulgaris]|nr:hypothetical protein DFH09DRAFT_1251065 [Mycena vulgaris]